MIKAKAISQLVIKELQQEAKDQNAILAILLYVLSSAYVSYLAFNKVLALSTWNALFWVIVLFGTFNATLRVFDKESHGRHYFLFQLASPLEIFFAKASFSSMLSTLVALMSWLCFMLFMGWPSDAFKLEQILWFLSLLPLAGIGLGSLLVLINGIAFKAGNGIGMASIMGLPIAVPLLLLLIRSSQHILAGQPSSVFLKYFISLILLDLIVIALASLLFPYLWRD